VSGTCLRSATNLSPFLIILDRCGLVNVVRPLRREGRSVVFTFCWASQPQPSSDLSPTVLTNKFYCLYFWDYLNLEGQVPLFIFLRNRVDPSYPRGTVKAKVIFRSTVSRPVWTSVRPPSGPVTNFSFSLKYVLNNSAFVILWPLLWREDGSVIYSCCWTSKSAVNLGFEYRDTQNHILLSQIVWLPQHGGPSPRIYIPYIYICCIYICSWALDSLSSPLISRRSTVEECGDILTRLHTIPNQSHVTTDGQSVSTSWCRAHCGTCYQILILSESCCFVFVERPLRREVGVCLSQSLSAMFLHFEIYFLLIHVTHVLCIYNTIQYTINIR
jgi:hypothetical protein